MVRGASAAFEPGEFERDSIEGLRVRGASLGQTENDPNGRALRG